MNLSMTGHGVVSRGKMNVGFQVTEVSVDKGVMKQPLRWPYCFLLSPVCGVSSRIMTGKDVQSEDSTLQDDFCISCCPEKALPYVAIGVHYLPKSFVIVGCILSFIGIVITSVAYSDKTPDDATKEQRTVGPVLCGIGGVMLLTGLCWLYWRHDTKMRYESREVYIPPRHIPHSKPKTGTHGNVYVVSMDKDNMSAQNMDKDCQDSSFVNPNYQVTPTKEPVPYSNGSDYSGVAPSHKVTHQQIRTEATIERNHITASPDLTKGTPNQAYQSSDSDSETEMNQKPPSNNPNNHAFHPQMTEAELYMSRTSGCSINSMDSDAF